MGLSGPKPARKNRMRRGTHARPLEGMRMTLVLAAGRGETVTYGTLMRRFHLSRGRALSAAIGEVDRLEYSSGAPGFAAIVVRKDTGYPGGGYFCDDSLPRGVRRPRWRGSDPRLSPAERSHIIVQQEKIWAHYARARSSSRR